MTNAFDAFGISHLSASSLNTWVSEPALWVMERLLKRGSPPGVAAHRGSAIERGIEVGLFDRELDVKACQFEALKEFDRKTALNPLAAKERAIIPDAVEIGLDELRKYGAPTIPDEHHQHKISIELDGVPIPIIGFLDFLYDEHGILIDLKTEHRLSSQIKSSHARQLAIYQAAKPNHEARVAYVTPKKAAVYRLEREASDKALNEIRQIAFRLERFLSLSNDPEELAALLCPNPDSFYWNNPQSVRNRHAVYGY